MGVCRPNYVQRWLLHCFDHPVCVCVHVLGKAVKGVLCFWFETGWIGAERRFFSVEEHWPLLFQSLAVSFAPILSLNASPLSPVQAWHTFLLLLSVLRHPCSSLSLIVCLSVCLSLLTRARPAVIHACICGQNHAAAQQVQSAQSFTICTFFSDSPRDQFKNPVTSQTSSLSFLFLSLDTHTHTYTPRTHKAFPSLDSLIFFRLQPV